MGEFRNLNELIMLIDKPTIVAIEYVTDKIIEELQMQISSKGIGLGNNSFYTSTGEFYDAWKAEIATRIGNYFQSVVYFASDTLTNKPDEFIHGSNYYGDSDVRDMMPYIIFGGNSGDLFGNGFWQSARDAWSPTISRLNRSFNKWIIEGFKISGLTISANTISVVRDID